MNDQCLNTFSLLGKTASRALIIILKSQFLKRELEEGSWKKKFLIYMALKKKAKTSIRSYLLIRLLNAERQTLDPQDLLTRVRAAFTCKTVVVTKELSESGGFHYRIGLQTTNASKHTYVKDLRNLFTSSEFSDKEFQVQSIKGAGTWSKELIEKSHQTLLIFGEFQAYELIEFARASRQHKKAQRVSDGPGPEKEKKRRGRPKKALPMKEESPQLDGTPIFFMRVFASFLKGVGSLLSKIFDILLKIILKSLFFWALYLYFVKCLDIKNRNLNHISNI